VNISIDKSYMLAATGTLQNANEIGFATKQTVKGKITGR